MNKLLLSHFQNDVVIKLCIWVLTKPPWRRMTHTYCRRGMAERSLPHSSLYMKTSMSLRWFTCLNVTESCMLAPFLRMLLQTPLKQLQVSSSLLFRAWKHLQRLAIYAFIRSFDTAALEVKPAPLDWQVWWTQCWKLLIPISAPLPFIWGCISLQPKYH